MKSEKCGVCHNYFLPLYVIMYMMKQRILYLVLLCAMCVRASAQATLLPSVDPKALYTTIKGDEIEDASESQEAPLIAHFTATPSDLGN